MVTLGIPPHPGRRPADWFEAIAASPRPAVVDYATGEGRVELSGRVLANWAAKTANLLDAEGLGPEATVAVDLPAAWQPLAALLGAARAGVGVVFTRAGSPADADLVLTDEPQAWASSPAELWAVGEDSSGGSGKSLAHALDFAAEVRVQADRCPAPVPGGDLVAVCEAWADAVAPETDGEDRHWARRERGLVVAAHGARLGRELARAVTRTWAAGLPAVLVPAQSTDDGGAAGIVSTERLGAVMTG